MDPIGSWISEDPPIQTNATGLGFTLRRLFPHFLCEFFPRHYFPVDPHPFKPPMVLDVSDVGVPLCEHPIWTRGTPIFLLVGDRLLPRGVGV